jgi:hypothetical protein
MSFEEMKSDYELGLTVKQLSIKYETKVETIKSRIKRGKWQRQPKKDLMETVEKAKAHLQELTGMDSESLKEQLFSEESDEVGEIQDLATIMLIVAKGGASTVKSTFVKDENGELQEKTREVAGIRPDVRAGMFFMELLEKLATMVDIGEFETDEELEARYKGYEERKKKEREEFANRVIE